MPAGSSGLLNHDGFACPDLQEQLEARPIERPLTSLRDHTLRRRDARCARHTGPPRLHPVAEDRMQRACCGLSRLFDRGCEMRVTRARAGMMVGALLLRSDR